MLFQVQAAFVTFRMY